MEAFVAFMEWVMMICFALGATFAAWTLQACIDVVEIVSDWLGLKLYPWQICHLGGALFLFLLIGLPVIAVAVGFATGQLPVKPH
jgi:hypothetical protein